MRLRTKIPRGFTLPELLYVLWFLVIVAAQVAVVAVVAHFIIKFW